MTSVLIAMSGGVDSSVAAALLVDAGLDVVGVTMKMHDTPEGSGATAGCCTVDDADDARAVAARLGIPHYTVDLSDPFGTHVVDAFVRGYAAGQTPNPCVECNRRVKFSELLDRADLLGIDLVATGHHARLESGRLLRATDRAKDQSYVLACVDPGVLRRLLFPVGGLAKADVRALATRLGLRTATKPDSMDVCFLGAGGPRPFLAARLDLDEGHVVDVSGAVVGAHDGAPLYTLGQRRGVGVASGRRMYVTAVDVAANSVTVSSSPPRCPGFEASGAVWYDRPDGPIRCDVQTSAHGRPAPGVVTPVAGDVVVRYDTAETVAAPGQLAAFYRGDVVLGSATVRAVGGPSRAGTSLG